MFNWSYEYSKDEYVLLCILQRFLLVIIDIYFKVKISNFEYIICI